MILIAVLAAAPPAWSQDASLVGTVTDFISVGSFPVFNVADSGISIGVALLVAAMWVEERRHREGLPEEPGPV